MGIWFALYAITAIAKHHLLFGQKAERDTYAILGVLVIYPLA